MMSSNNTKGYHQMFKKFASAIKNKKALSGGGLFILIIILFLPQWQHFNSIINDTIAPDLLLRTIGSRLQKAGMPVYSYQWKNGDPAEWLNIYPDLRVGLNGVISTPFALWLLQPFSKLNYCDIKMIWGYLQEFLLFASVWLCCKTFTKISGQVIFLLFATFFFIYDSQWLLHLYNGQMYVMYTFVFSLIGYLVLRLNNQKQVVFLLPILSAIRPFFIFSLLPFLKLKKWVFIALSVGVFTAMTLIILSTTVSQWKYYNHAMNQYAKEATGGLKVDSGQMILNVHYADACIVNKTKGFKVFNAGCLYSLQHYLILLGIRISKTSFYQAILAVFLLAFWFISYKKNWLNNPLKQLILAFIYYQACELLVPAVRNPYNMVQWLPAIGWLVLSGKRTIILIVLIGLYLNHSFTFLFKYEREIGEMILFVALGILLMNNKIMTSLQSVRDSLTR